MKKLNIGYKGVKRKAKRAVLAMKRRVKKAAKVLFGKIEQIGRRGLIRPTGRMGLISKFATGALVFGLLLQCGGLAFIKTSAYFNDEEISTANTYTAGTLDLALTSIENFFPQLTPTQNSARDITVAKQGGLGFQYKVKIDNLSGDFCRSLNLKATLNSNILYDGSLAGFNIATTTDLGIINLVASSNAHGFNQACNFNLVFTAWQVNLDNENLGFSDEESVSNSIVGGQDDVVLNEFLPNPIGDDSQNGLLGEWVEFYNNSDHAIDMTGWYTEDAVGASHRRIVSAATTYNGQTTIGAKGSGTEWLVLFMDDNILNNDSDTVNLYDNYGGLVDTYSYSGSDYNINDTPGATNNLVAYLPFNDVLLDKSGNNNNGTNFGTTFSTGKIGKGLTLGSSEYVEVPDSASLDITDKITLEAWVYPTAWDNTHENSILTKAGDGEYGVWNLHYKTTTSGFRFELNNGSSHALFETIPSTALSAWYHVVGVYDGSEMKLYVNGVLKGSLATSGSIATNNSPLRIGKQFWWGSNYSYWTGKIDEVKIYSRALSAAEVLEHYNTVNNGSASIPENKSFARIPDGTGAWVDPVPTPGGPNSLDASEVEPMLCGLSNTEVAALCVAGPEEQAVDVDQILQSELPAGEATATPLESSSLTPVAEQSSLQGAAGQAPESPTAPVVEQESTTGQAGIMNQEEGNNGSNGNDESKEEFTIKEEPVILPNSEQAPAIVPEVIDGNNNNPSTGSGPAAVEVALPPPAEVTSTGGTNE